MMARPMRRNQCQYCGRIFTGNHVTVHSRACLENPSLLEELSRILDDGTGRCVRRKTYAAMVYRPVEAARIVMRFGSWDDAARALGLKIPDKLPQSGLNAPLTDAERFCCQRRASVEWAYYPSK